MGTEMRHGGKHSPDTCRLSKRNAGDGRGSGAGRASGGCRAPLSPLQGSANELEVAHGQEGESPDPADGAAAGDRFLQQCESVFSFL